MQEIIDFLMAGPGTAFYLATADEQGRPRVRPFGLVFEWESRLTFYMNDTKKVYKQLQANPYVEVCCFIPERGEWLRVSGKVELFKSAEANKKAFGILPSLKAMYHSEKNPTIACASIIEGKAAYYNFSTSHEPLRVVKF